MSDPSHSKELKSLADYLSKNQDSLLAKWKKVMKETEGNSPNLAVISEDKFQDHIPEFLDRLYSRLRNEEPSSEKIGKKHGAERWEHGIDLQQTMREWNKLHLVLMQAINEFQGERSFGPASLREAQKLLAVHIQDGILLSVEEFDKLQRKESKAQLDDLKQVLEDPKRELRDQNLRGTSHDLKGLMYNLKMGFFLLEDQKVSKRAAQLIDQMSAAADSLEQLLNDLLDLFRLEAGQEKVKVTTFKVDHILNELCESLQPMANAEDLELLCTGDDSLEVKSDLAKVQRIVRNLGLNALKYTKKGSVKINWKRKSENNWMITVSDTGPGLSATHAASLTSEADAAEPTYKPKRKGVEKVQNHGEGIGLLIVRHLCKLLDAVIEIETGPETGTTFSIVFPVDISHNHSNH